jgi:hypothetical protein
MKYSEVVKAGLILPKKEKYTMHDVNKIINNSLFEKQETLTVNQAKFIARCSAVFHNTWFSKEVAKNSRIWWNN